MFLFHEKYFCWKWELHVFRIKPSTSINAFFKLLNNTLNAFVVECKILRRFFLFYFAHKILLDSIMSTKTFFKSLSAGWRCLTRNIPLKNKLFRRKKKKCFTETAFLHFFVTCCNKGLEKVFDWRLKNYNSLNTTHWGVNYEKFKHSTKKLSL
jgi:hypothetical protein